MEKFGASYTTLDFLISAMEEESISSAQILNQTGISHQDLNSTSTIISLDQILKCYKNAVQLANDDSLGYRLGFKINISTLGAVGFALLCATDMRQALRFSEDFYTLTSTVVVLTFKESESMVSCSIKPVVEMNLDSQLYKFLSEYYVSGIYNIMREMIGDQFFLESISFPYLHSGNNNLYDQSFNCQISYGAPEVVMKFDKSWLDYDNPKGNSITFTQVKKYCQTQLNEIVSNQGVTGVIRKLYLSEPINNLTLKTASDKLNMSERTLSRRLQAEQTNFRQIIDTARRELAINYLKNTDLSIDSIAFQLGYSCSFTFRQAVHRWTNMTPSKIRTQYSQQRLSLASTSNASNNAPFAKL